MKSANRGKVYEIRNAEGRLVAKHHRRDNSDGTKAVWWEKDSKKGLNGTPMSDLPLYGSELVAELHPDELIVLVEGEKTRDALEDARIPALGTVTGASGTPGAEALEVLRDRRVCLWPDGDDAGRKHMERIAEILDGVAAEVLIYTWHDAPEDVKGPDAADHPAVQSKDLKALGKLRTDLEGAPRSVSQVSQERNGQHSGRLNFRTAKEVAETTPQEVPWISRPWLAKGAITEIDGPIKRAGKTTLVFHNVACILDGKPFIGEPTTKSKAVCLTEQPPTSFRKVLERAGLTDREDLLILHWHDTIGTEWPEVAKAAADKAVEFGADVLVVDTLGQFAGIRGDSENSAGAAQEAMQPLQEAAALGLAVVITRHERKGGGEVGESARGSSAFGGAVDIIMSVRRHQGEARPTVRVIESLSRFDETPDKLVVELTDDGYRSLGDASAFAEKEAMKAIVEFLPARPENAMKTDEVLDKLKEHEVKRTVANEALAKLTAAGTIRRIGEGKRGDPYRYYKPVPEDKKDSSALKNGVPEERKDGLSPTTMREETAARILSSGTSTYIAEERNEEPHNGIHVNEEGEAEF